MHNLLEGICRYDLRKCLNYFINSQYLSLDVLNERIQYFNVSPDANMPQLRFEAIKKKEIILSASEMNYFYDKP